MVLPSIGPTATLYGAALTINLVLAAVSGDWRLRRVVAVLFIAWLATNILPYTEIIASPIALLLFSRLQIRRERETTLSWWMVPVIVAEAGISLSHLIYPVFGYFTYWALVQALFAAQLAVSTWVGGRLSARRLLRDRRIGRNGNFFARIRLAPVKP